MAEYDPDDENTPFFERTGSGEDDDQKEEARRKRKMDETGESSWIKPKATSTPNNRTVDGETYKSIPTFMPDGEHDGSVEDIEKRLFRLKFDENTRLPKFPDSGKLNLSEEDKAKCIERVQKFIKIEHPQVSKELLKSVRFTQDANRNPYDIVVIGKKGREYKVVKNDGTGLMQELYTTKYIKDALGPKAFKVSRELTIKMNAYEEKKDLRDKQAKKAEEIEMIEIDNLDRQREKILQEVAEKDSGDSETEALEEQAKQLEKKIQEKRAVIESYKKKAAERERDLDEKKKGVEEILQRKADISSLEQMKNIKTEVQTKNASFRQIIEDPGASETEKDQARENLKAGENEEAFWENAIQEREDPRLSTRVKVIFRKYGLTITAILTAASLAVSSVVAALMASAKNASAAAGKAMQKGLEKIGNGLKELGGKLANLLPGLIGAIASFLFKTAASVVGFLAKNTWLLIVAAVWFAYEQLSKRRDN